MLNLLCTFFLTYKCIYSVWNECVKILRITFECTLCDVISSKFNSVPSLIIMLNIYYCYFTHYMTLTGRSCRMQLGSWYPISTRTLMPTSALLSPRMRHHFFNTSTITQLIPSSFGPFNFPLHKDFPYNYLMALSSIAYYLKVSWHIYICRLKGFSFFGKIGLKILAQSSLLCIGTIKSSQVSLHEWNHGWG